ncbi:hypothetical protein BHE74_00044528 [Ensete ventricosum]|uniref:Uncharacterized protein n=1 Tax=Ensete ventricosum TaxID=4639 RepID=A0A445MHD0_ENSVE|nr:hypothetical protein BHE74_00044528 [Ensete ventricosum]RZR73672.1 hypothetical protein BHM03_00026833 [Ensete ventricosum]
MMRMGTHLECVGSLPRVLGAYQDGAREFIERRSRLIERLSGITKKLARSIEKIARNMLGERRRKIIRLIAGIARGCRIARVRS